MQFLSILSFTLLAANTAVASSYNDYDSQLNDRDVYPEMLLEKYLLRRYIDSLVEDQPLRTRSLWKRIPTQAEITAWEQKMVEQATKCDAINYERDNLTPGPTPKAKKDDLAKKLTACKNAYLQQGTRLARMKAEMKGQR